jgi:hypothetical protein
VAIRGDLQIGRPLFVGLGEAADRRAESAGLAFPRSVGAARRRDSLICQPTETRSEVPPEENTLTVATQRLGWLASEDPSIGEVPCALTDTGVSD